MKGSKMAPVKIIRNEDVEKVLIGVPKGHKHLRVCVKLKDNSALVFQEATIANVLRAYITLKTHPSVKAQELKMQTLSEPLRKQEYALHQLLETPRNQEEIEEELKELLKKHI